MLHETAIAWIKDRIIQSNLKLDTPWTETPQQFAGRLKSIVKDVNATCKVKELSLEFTSRLRDVKKREGGRLPK